MPRQVAVEKPQEVAEELVLLRGFRDLVGERTGYMFGAKALSKTMSEKTEAERKAVRDAGKVHKEALKTLIETPNKKNSTAVQTAGKDLEKAREANKKAREPHMEKITPLRRAVRYIDNVAVPDSLKELGTPVAPRFSLSDVISNAIKQKKK